MTETTSVDSTTETVEEFKQRAAAWLAANVPSIDPLNPPDADRGEDGPWLRARELQKKLYEGGFAGICFPREYGGLGLPIAYQRAFDDASRGYEMPIILNVPTFTICAATILDTGSEDQKRQHISGAIRGDEVLVQLLSEPSGGSDLASVITRADRKGDKWIINGAKTWSTSAFAADYGLLLARTAWDVPKHEGLTMFLVKLDSPGIDMRRIKQVDGGNEFCEEFFDNLELDDDAVVGEVNDGWNVASRQLYHERRAVGGGSEFASGIGAEGKTDRPVDYVALVTELGQSDNERIREMAGRALVRARCPRAADRSRVPRRARRNPASRSRFHHPHLARRERPVRDRHHAGDGRQRWSGRRWQWIVPSRKPLPFPTAGIARRRNHRDCPKHHRGAHSRLPTRIRRRSWRAVQSGEAQAGLDRVGPFAAAVR